MQKIFEGSKNGIKVDCGPPVCMDMPAKHFHDEYEIYYLAQGERCYFIEQHTYRIQKGDLVIIDSRQIHKTSSLEKSSYYRLLVEFKEEPFASFFSSMGGLDLKDFFAQYQGVLKLPQKDQRRVIQCFLGMAKEIEEKREGSDLALMMELARLLICIIRSSAGPVVPEPVPDHGEIKEGSVKYRLVNDAASYIAASCTRCRTLEEIADHFYVSKSYLSRIFKEVTGFTVNEYIHIHRVRRGQKLLKETTLNMTEIADALGYESLTYFEKMFKKYARLTPLKFRKDYLNSVVRPSIVPGEDEVNIHGKEG